MKKALNFLTLPLAQLLVLGIGAVCFYSLSRTGFDFIAFLAVVAIIIYIAAGWLYSKAEDKKIRIASIICTVLLMWVLNGTLSFLSLSESSKASGNLLYWVFLSNPIVTDITNRTIDLIKIEPPVYATVLSALSPISVAISVAAGKVFEMKNKKAKIVLFVITAAVCITFLVLGIVDITK